MSELPPLSVYVHWPYCARVCPYCDFNVVRERGRGEEQAALAAAIVDDLKGQAARIGRCRLVSVFFGGGTPSLMAPHDVSRLLCAAMDLWPPADEVEVTLEANPTDAERGRFEAFAAAGVNRLSLGLQALDDAALRFLGRSHTADEGVRAAETAAAIFERLSLDLIYARPGQRAEAWARELERGLELGAEHMSPYQLTIEPGTAFDRAVRRGLFSPPGGEAAAELYAVTQQVLSRRGFEAYEVSNHARTPAARSRHNLAYWKGNEYLGVGPGAHGRVRVDGARTATRTAPRIRDYIETVAAKGVGWSDAEALGPTEMAEERLLLGLRTVEGVDLAELRPLGVDGGSHAVRELQASGHLELRAGRLIATSPGRLVLDRVVAELALARDPA